MRMTDERLAELKDRIFGWAPEDDWDHMAGDALNEAMRARASEARLVEALKECLPLLASECEQSMRAMQAPARGPGLDQLQQYQAYANVDGRSRAREIIRAAIKEAESNG